MQEKDMVLDVLSVVKSSIGSYAKIITETNDQNLRQTFQQMRDGDETFQYQLYQIAAQKGYYAKPPQASQADANQVKSSLSQGQTQAGTQQAGTGTQQIGSQQAGAQQAGTPQAGDPAPRMW